MDTTIDLFSLRYSLAKADFPTTTICSGMSKLGSINLSPGNARKQCRVQTLGILYQNPLVFQGVFG